MSRVFAGWVVFCAIIGLTVFLAPGLSETFTLTTLAALLLFTFALLLQSRMAEGWPSVLLIDDGLAVVRDPHKREFIVIPMHLVADTEPAVIKPSQKAIAVLLHQDRLKKNDVELLQRAVWPREDRVLALAYFKSPAQICAQIEQSLTFQKSQQ